MKILRKTIRFIAAFLTINMLYYTFYPTIAYALTSGPTAPEATSFEPVDTTDMVNLQTGDFTYNVPLLEVPGPSGGYPLSLSYHAGIQPHEDASWVGLGWTLNPGAINRNVNGYADDHENVANTDRQFWEGEAWQSYSLGVSYGVPGSPSSFSAGLTVSHNTYEGYGMSYYGYGGGTSNLNGIGGKGIGAGFSVGNSQIKSQGLQNPTTPSFSGSLANQVYSTGISLTTNGGSFTFNGRGISAVNNSKRGNISSEQHGFGIPIPLYNSGYWLNIGRQYKRVWLDNEENVETNGALHFPRASNYADEADWFKTHAYDAYSIVDRDSPGGFVYNSSPNLGLGGTFPNYDDYYVNAQGLAGGMRPHLFQAHLAKQNEFKSGTEISKTFLTGLNNDDKVQFRFQNDFSNRYQYDEGEFDLDDPDRYIMYDFGTPETGDSFDDGIEDNDLAGSKHIKYFTNQEIINKYDDEAWLTSNNFIKTNSPGFVRNDLSTIGEQIGAFTITNESGVKYHFALPVYSYDEWFYSQNIKKEEDDGDSFNYLKKPEKYAYTWYLTAVTGPDFVDKGTIGVLDEEDWGYWVEFDYGKWVDDFGWRNPVQGMHVDIDDEFENFSRGKKELYYLNSIKTKTHVAVFEKKMRADGKGVSFSGNTVVSATPEEGVTYLETGGFYLYKDNQGFYDRFPKATLGLSNIYLLPRNEYELLGGDAIAEEGILGGGVTHTIDGITKTIEVHHGLNVIDESDKQVELKAKAIRTISFEQDYSLVPGTVNSFDEAGSLYTDNPTPTEANDETANKLGKLTLKKLFFLGHGDDDSSNSLIPPVEFDYDIPQEYQIVVAQKEAETIVGDYTIRQRVITGGDFEHGDPVKVVYPDGSISYCTIRVDEGETTIKYVTGDQQDPGLSVYGVLIAKTKNPAFEKDAYDIWGMYKSDIDYATLDKSEWEARKVTEASANSLDAWSLRSIKTSLGSTIGLDYEPDRYERPALYKDVNTVPIGSIEPIMVQGPLPELPKKAVKFIFDEEIPENFISLSGVIGIPYLHAIPITENILNSHIYNFMQPTFEAKSFEMINNNSEFHEQGIDEDGKNFIIFENDELYDHFDMEPSEDGKNYPSGVPDWVPAPWTADLGTVPQRKVTHVYVGGAHLLQGNLNYKTNENEDVTGGGIRTSKISIVENFKKSTTHYNYHLGVTSYEPSYINHLSRLEYPDLTIDDYPEFAVDDYSEDEFYKNNRYYQNTETNAVDINTQGERAQAAALITQNNSSLFDDVLDHSAAIPPPGVLYPEVSVSESISHNGTEPISIGGLVKYRFSTFAPSKVKLSKYAPDGGNVADEEYTKWHTAKVVLKDQTAHIGQLQEVITYDKKGDPITRRKNHFLAGATYDTYKTNLENQFGGQGIIEETYSEARVAQIENSYYEFFEIFPGNLDYHLLGIITQHEQIPLVLQKQENTNYKTGITTLTENLGFDFYSGAVTKTLSTDGYGNTYISETVPAYKQYGGEGGMGLAINGGKNMLTQEAASYTYKVSDPVNLNREALISSNIQTWGARIPLLGTEAYKDYNVDIFVDFDEGLNEIVWVLSANQSDFSLGQQVKFISSDNTYLLDLGAWNSDIEGFIISNANDLQLPNNISESGIIEDPRPKNWRKHRSYSYTGEGNNMALTGDGLFAYAEVDHPDFDSWFTENTADLALWQKNSEITLYDPYSHALEVADINGNLAATKMDINQEQVYASVTNASYNEFAYSGAEDDPINNYYGGEVFTPSGQGTRIYHIENSSLVHTGNHSIRTNASEVAFQYEAEANANRKYLVSTWSNKDDIVIKYSTDGGTTEQTLTGILIKRSGDAGWYQHSAYIDIGGQTDLIVKVYGTSTLTDHDDFRIHPIDAPMTSYVYNSWGELSHVLDNNNLYTHYKYDDMGRLKSTHRETFQYGEVKLSEHEIKYARKGSK